MKLDELIKTVYSENDFSRSIATTTAGISGLLTYIWKGDWVISAFTAMIVFPITRIIADTIHANWVSRHEKVESESKLREQFDRFYPDEKEILRFFVLAGGACVSWGFVDKSRLPFPRPALNSLMQRGIVHTSVMEDGMTESFVLDVDVFDHAQKYLTNEFWAE
jgi:hypothetical protein